jgi:hypothetical protein
MKSIFTLNRLLWIGAALSLLTGCTPSVSPSTQLPTITWAPTESLVPSPTRSSTPTQIFHPVVTQPSPEVTRTTIDTSTLPPSTPSATPVPTLTAKERQNTFLEFLRTNAGCKLPCWWGVIPGKTNWSEVEKLLNHMGVNIFSFPQPDGTILNSPGDFDFEDNIQYIFGFTEKNNIVEDIYLRSIGDSNPVGFQSALESYSPRQVMADYGAPSRVWMYTDSMDYGERTGYSLWLAYDNLGFLIRYEGFVQQRDQPIYRICPRFDQGMDIQEIGIVLQSPDNPRPLEKRDPLYSEKVQYTHTLEDATGLTVDEFYKLFTQDKKPACFDTPKNIWPSSFP